MHSHSCLQRREQNMTLVMTSGKLSLFNEYLRSPTDQSSAALDMATGDISVHLCREVDIASKESVLSVRAEILKCQRLLNFCCRLLGTWKISTWFTTPICSTKFSFSKTYGSTERTCGSFYSQPLLAQKSQKFSPLQPHKPWFAGNVCY